MINISQILPLAHIKNLHKKSFLDLQYEKFCSMI